MSGNVVCHDASRQRVFDELSSYFLREEPFSKGECSICGARDVNVNESGRCRAQVALTQKRHTAAEGHPVAYGSPLKDADKRGYFSLTDQHAAILVRADRSVFTGKVVPTSPLPRTVEVRTEQRFEDLLDELVQQPEEGAILAVFNKKGNVELRLSTESILVVNGGAVPIALDRQRLLHAIDLVVEHGDAAVKQAIQVKRAIVDTPAKAREMSDKLKKTAPALAAALKSVPNGGPEIQFAYAIARNRYFRAQNQE